MNLSSTSGLTMGRAIPAGDAQPREREIPDLLGQLMGAAESASTSLDMLVKRIDPVLRSASPTAGDAGSQMAAYTGLGSQLYNLLQRVRGLDALAQDALGRLELP